MNNPGASHQECKMQFILSGFREHDGFRLFAFTGIAADYTRAEFTVKTNLTLARKYGIRLQELPLLCRELLDVRTGEQKRNLTYSEDCMRAYAVNCAAAAALRKVKSNRRPPNNALAA